MFGSLKVIFTVGKQVYSRQKDSGSLLLGSKMKKYSSPGYVELLRGATTSLFYHCHQVRSFGSLLPVLVFPGGQCLRDIASQSRRRKLKFFGFQSGLQNVGKQSPSVWLEMQLVKSLATIQSATAKREFSSSCLHNPLFSHLPFCCLRCSSRCCV